MRADLQPIRSQLQHLKQVNNANAYLAFSLYELDPGICREAEWPDSCRLNLYTSMTHVKRQHKQYTYQQRARHLSPRSAMGLTMMVFLSHSGLFWPQFEGTEQSSKCSVHCCSDKLHATDSKHRCSFVVDLSDVPEGSSGRQHTLLFSTVVHPVGVD